MNLQILDQVRTTSGASSAATGIGTVAVKASENAGMLNWMDENAVRIGVVCTIFTAVVYGVTSGIKLYLDIRHEKNRKQ